MRLESQSRAVWEAYPEGWLDPIELFTDLGGPEGAVLVLAVLYWLVDRERAARVAVYVIAGGAFLLALKFGLELPRPDEALETGDDPYGFPSGHAFNAVVLYGGLLYVFEKLDDWRYLLGTVFLIVSISLTRIFLRVHYFGDLIVGALLGIAVIMFLEHFVDDLRLGFGLGVVGAALAVGMSGFHEYTIAIFGISVGAFVASFLMDAVPPLQSRAEGGILVVLGLAYIIVFTLISDALVADASGVVDNLLVIGSHALIVIGVFLIPLAVRPIERQRQALMQADQSV